MGTPYNTNSRGKNETNIERTYKQVYIYKRIKFCLAKRKTSVEYCLGVDISEKCAMCTCVLVFWRRLNNQRECRILRIFPALDGWIRPCITLCYGFPYI